eukprot:10806189-Alexandrium_andersonii.AAC.1
MGLLLDREKCFDWIARQVTFALTDALGCPSGIIMAHLGIYERVRRYIKVGRSSGQGFAARHGVFKDALSAWMTSVCCWLFGRTANMPLLPPAASTTYVDDSNTVAERKQEMRVHGRVWE